MPITLIDIYFDLWGSSNKESPDESFPEYVQLYKDLRRSLLYLEGFTETKSEVG